MNRVWIYPFLAGLAIRLILAWYGHGFRQMDEHWQIYEPANFLVNGVWSRTVEWEQGLRCWIYPWLISQPMRLAGLLGFQEPIWIAAFVRSSLTLLSSLAIPLAYFTTRAMTTTARSSFGNERITLAAAWLVALWPYAAYSGIRAHNEMTAALFVLAAVAAPALLASRERAGYILSGAMFGTALALKIDVAVAGLGYGVWQLLHLRVRRALWLLVGVLPFVALIGLADKLAWNTWFQSILGHWHANMVEQVGNQWGVSPWYMHVFYFFNIVGPVALVALTLPLSWRRLPEALRATWFMNAFFVAVFAAIPHKEKRFLAPLVLTGLTAAVATFAYVEFRLQGSRRKLALAAFGIALGAHFTVDAVTYFIKRPWWDRVHAMKMAGEVSGIEKMFSPQWPAVFYLPRHIAAEVIGSDDASLGKATQGLKRFSVASDWTHLRAIEKWGFKCEPSPKPRPTPEREIPWSWVCDRN